MERKMNAHGQWNSWRGMLKDGDVKCDVNENMWLNAEDWAD